MPCLVLEESAEHNNIYMAALMFIFALMLSLLSVQGDVKNQKCNPVGTKSITISWEFSPTQGRKPPHTFVVYFCKTMTCQNTSIDYHFGCTVNVMKGKPNYSCDIGKPLNLQFPQESTFNYYVKEDNGLPVSLGRCPVNILIQCSKPTGLKLIPVRKGELKLSWSKPTDMGRSSEHLCYFIEYFSEDSPEYKAKKTFGAYNTNYEYEIRSLRPFQRYHVYLQCALSCIQKKSLPAGPAIATTLEEEPQDQVIFQNWFQTTVDHESRNVTLFLEIPDKEKWNGRVRQIRVFCYRDEHLCTNITLDELVLSDGRRHLYNVTFPFLRRDMTYYVLADYCNSVGCSPTSRNQTIKPTPLDGSKVWNLKPHTGNSLSTEQLVGIGVGAFAVLVVIGVIIMVIKRHRSNSEPHENLENIIGPLDPGSPRENEVVEEQADDVYSRADANVPRVSRSTLHPETTDFQSASVRSINSFNSISGLTDQSTIKDDNSASIPNNEESSNLQENVRLLRRGDFSSVRHRPSQEEDSILPTSV